MNTITSTDMQRDVRLALGDYAADFDVPGIVAALIAWYGRCDVDSIPEGPFWSIVGAWERVRR